MTTKHTEERPTLSFDGRGINGPDEYRTRLATFTSRKDADTWGPLFAAAPDLLAALEILMDNYTFHKADSNRARLALSRAKGGV